MQDCPCLTNTWKNEDWIITPHRSDEEDEKESREMKISYVIKLAVIMTKKVPEGWKILMIEDSNEKWDQDPMMLLMWNQYISKQWSDGKNEKEPKQREILTDDEIYSADDDERIPETMTEDCDNKFIKDLLMLKTRNYHLSRLMRN